MWKRLQSLLINASPGASSMRPKRSDERDSSARYTQRMGQVTKADEVFDAWTSGELAPMLKALKKNDPVATIGGILGTVVSVSEDGLEVVVRVDDNTRIKFRHDAIREVIQKDEGSGD